MDSSSRAVAEVAWGSRDAHVQSAATRRPRTQAVGARSTPHLPFGFAAKPSPSKPWARGLLSASWERGSLDLPACGLRRGSRSGPVWPVIINLSSRPSRGAKPRGADDVRLPQGRPHQADSRRGREIKARSTSRGAPDASHDDRDQSRRQPKQGPRFLFGAKGASIGAEYRGIQQRFPYRCNETKTSRTEGW